MPRRRRRKASFWIQEAIQKPGALREWLERNEDKVRRLTGEPPFTRKGTVNARALLKLRELHRKGKVRLSDTTIRRINLALTLRRLARR